MAAQLKLVRLDDFIADIDSVDLLTSGFSLASNGYAPAVAPIGAASVDEVITLNLQGTSTDDLALLVQDIDRKIKQVQWWIDNPGVEKYQVWIRAQMEGESYARQAQILNIEPADKVEEFPDTENADHYIRAYSFGIERTPFWEQPYPYTRTSSVSDVASLGGMEQVIETIEGDVPARLAQLTLTPRGSSTLGTFWCGWKSGRFGTIANFTPVWALSDGAGGTDTTEVADATCASGTNLTCTFATVATLTQRAIMRVDQATANVSDQRGTYNVLLRAHMSDTSIARLRMTSGFSVSGIIYSPTVRQRVVISGTGWTLYEIGQVSFPPQRISSTASFANDSIALEAERLSGAGNLLLDCLILIPVDDGAVKLELPVAEVGSNTGINVFQAADGSVRGYADAAGAIVYSVTPKPINWGLPSNFESPAFVVAAVGGPISTSGESLTLDMTYTYIPRWRTLRGSGAFGT